jgi:hypothetical protein
MLKHNYGVWGTLVLAAGLITTSHTTPRAEISVTEGFKHCTAYCAVLTLACGLSWSGLGATCGAIGGIYKEALNKSATPKKPRALGMSYRLLKNIRSGALCGLTFGVIGGLYLSGILCALFAIDRFA